MAKSLAERYAAAARAKKIVEARVEKLKNEMLIKMAKDGTSTIIGTEYDVVFSETTESRLDTKKVRNFLNAKQIEEFSYTSTKKNFTISKRKEKTIALKKAA